MELDTPRLSADDARTLTDRIKRVTVELWETVRQAWDGRAWEALNYDSWQAYCATEFDSAHLSLPKDERGRVVAMLSDAGMSTRAIAAAANVDRKTIDRDKAAGTNVPPKTSEQGDELTQRYIYQTAQSIYHFAGISSYEECVTLRDALQKSLKRLDARIKAKQPKEN